MKKIETLLEINAPLEKVWSTLMNHKEYPNWNPFVQTIAGSAIVGEKLATTIQLEGKKPMSFKPIVLVNKTNQEFRWKGKMFVNGLFDGEHYFILEKIDAEKTRFIHGEQFSGLLTGLFMKMIGKQTQIGFEAMNAALKSQAESQK
ncbi:MAG: hypothetical protein ACJASQ_001633 [Crocinitomicaceae bacterium]|jgi:hypothetical protein